MDTKLLPMGIYRYELTPIGWFLERTGSRFEFPYKIYGNHESILQRVKRAWAALDSNLGILLNGIKGTGKTVSAQLLANWALDNGIPVLVVSHPVPLGEILEKLEQPVLVIFDEFEKTHQKPEHQQALLTAIDGMARNAYKRLFIFTTNTKQVDPNFIDRPSRIRYNWEFKRLEDDVIEEILDDLLDTDLQELRADILTYLATRKVVSIDVVKTIIQEVNIFREAPEAFSAIVNLTEQDARGFTVEVLDEKRQPTKTLSAWFTLHRGENTRLRAMLTKSGRAAWVDSNAAYGESSTFHDRVRDLSLDIIHATDDPNEWVAHLKLPFFDTWVSKFRKLEQRHYNENIWLDQRPEDWRIPEWAHKFQAGTELTDEENAAMCEWISEETVYGTDKHQDVLIRITPNFESRTYTTWSGGAAF